MSLLIAIIFALCLVAPPIGAEEQNVNPGINQYYYDAEFQRWVSIFERPGREVYDKRHTIISTLALKPGMEVADIGAGTGFYTHLFAKKVGTSGKVYAVDIAENFIENILRSAKEQGLNNVEGIINTPKSTKLSSASIDLAFICDTYHHFEYPQTMLASIHQALRPGGQLVIIDFRKQPGMSSGWVMSHVRTNQVTVIKEVESAGFRLISQHDLLHSNYFLTFVKNGN
ncbi:MAG: methyltransferase domain-containing protein [Halobacteria archaeon]|nr:methyltransferase domain-containing protein [Halobacteria archaeon]